MRRPFNRLCTCCGEQFSTQSPSKTLCSMDCKIQESTIPGVPKHVTDNGNCRIWVSDYLDGQPIIFTDKIEKLRDTQVKVPEGKRLIITCGNRNCVNKDHYEIVDDLSMFGFI